MLLSQYLLPVFKESPAEAIVASHQLMLRAGIINKLASGLYVWLPFGLRVLHKVESVIRREMNHAGAIELRSPTLQPISLWEKSGRYRWGVDMMAETLKMKDRHNVEMVFAPTAEEIITNLFSEVVVSYKELPKNLYQIGTKFRDEIRPRYGLLRSREFYMKDSYSFHLNEEDALNTYNIMLKTYLKIFTYLGLDTIPVTASSGDIGGKYSHEFHVLTKIGESKIYFDRSLLTALLNENFDIKILDSFYAREEAKHDSNNCPLSDEELISSNGIEVGQIFYLDDKYSKAMDVKIQTKGGNFIHPKMGTYGIGISRLIAACIEANHDDKGIIWHPNVAPFQCIVINLRNGDNICDTLAKSAYEALQIADIDTIYDDTQESAGVKLAKADLIGIPIQIIIGPNNAQMGIIEIKDRRSGVIIHSTTITNLVAFVNKHINHLSHH